MNGPGYTGHTGDPSTMGGFAGPASQSSYGYGGAPPNQPVPGRSPNLLHEYNVKYRKYIDLIDRLRGFGLDQQLPLPRVAVIGVQSCGKSSVLEGISGVCLPRGTGTVTRCPIELQLKNITDRKSRWSGRMRCRDESGQVMERTLTTPEAVSNIVIEAQHFLAGNNDLSAQPIVLEIHSPDVPNLTLVDLPGLIEVPMRNQPAELPEKIYSLVKEYISMSETIIMVVVACNTELATTKALKMAKEVDNDGIRTLGVLTKPDLIDKGTEEDILSMVANPSRHEIRKGFTLVKLRSQKDVQSNISHQEALQNEERFFDANFQHLSHELVGTPSLATKLTYELVNRIKEVLPSLKQETQNKLAENERALRKLGVDVPEEMRARSQFLTDNLNKFVNKVRRISDGIYDSDVPPDQRLLYLTRPVIEEFALTVEDNCPNGDDSMLLERIAKEIREQRGGELPGFLPFKACQTTIQALLQDFVQPSKICLQKTNACVEKFLNKVATEIFGVFPPLEAAIKVKVDDLRQTAFDECNESIEQTFEMEYQVIIPDILFYNSTYAIQRAPQQPGPASYDYVTHEQANNAPSSHQARKGPFRRRNMPTEQPIPMPPPEVVKGESRDSNATEYTMDKIAIYFKSALDRLMANIPMKVHWFLIKRLSEQIQSHVIAMATDPETLELLMEDDQTATLREELDLKIAQLKEAQQQLAKI